MASQFVVSPPRPRSRGAPVRRLGALLLLLPCLLAGLLLVPHGRAAATPQAPHDPGDPATRFGPGFDDVLLHDTVQLEELRTSLALTSLTVPAGRGSAHPHLASVGGTTVLSWLEPDAAGDGSAVLAQAVFVEGGWQRRPDVARGADWFVNWADFPSVTPVAGSLWAAHWLVRRPGGRYRYDVRVALSRDGGDTWPRQLTPHRDDTPTEHGFVSMFPWHEGNGEETGVGIVWLDGRETVRREDASSTAPPGMTLRAARIDTAGNLHREAVIDDLVCDCCQTDVAIGGDGPIVAYRNRTPTESRNVHTARFADAAWHLGGKLGEGDWQLDGCPVNGPAIDARGEQAVVAWYDGSGDVARVLLARSDDAGATFGDAVVIDGANPLGRVDVALLPSGAAAVTWMQHLDDERASLSLQFVGGPAGRSPTYRLALTRSGRASGFPQMVRHDDDAGTILLLAWTDASGERVRSMAFDPWDLPWAH